MIFELGEMHSIVCPHHGWLGVAVSPKMDKQQKVLSSVHPFIHLSICPSIPSDVWPLHPSINPLIHWNVWVDGWKGE